MSPLWFVVLVSEKKSWRYLFTKSWTLGLLMVTWEDSAGWIDSSQTASSTFRCPVTKAAGTQREDTFPIIFRAILSYDKRTSSKIWIILNLCLKRERCPLCGWFVSFSFSMPLIYKLPLKYNRIWLATKVNICGKSLDRWSQVEGNVVSPAAALTHALPSPAAKKIKVQNMREKKLHICHLLWHTPHKSRVAVVCLFHTVVLKRGSYSLLVQRRGHQLTFCIREP